MTQTLNNIEFASFAEAYEYATETAKTYSNHSRNFDEPTSVLTEQRNGKLTHIWIHSEDALHSYRVSFEPNGIRLFRWTRSHGWVRID